MKVTYENKIFEVNEKTTVYELLKEDIEREPTKVVACMFNNEVKSLNHEISEDGELRLINLTDKDGNRVYVRGLLYVICKAISSLYPQALLTINFQLYHSMLCEIENLEITDEIIENINKKVKEIVEKDLPIEKKIMTKEEAINFYKNHNTLKGKLQLDLKEKKEVTLYFCEDYYNYFYGVIPIRTGIMDIYEIKKYHNGVLIRYPSRKHPNELPEFKENKKLLETLDEYENVHEILKIDTLYKLNNIVKDGKIKDYIMLDEALHEKKIANIADTILESKKRVILIAGPSSSGKTTFSKRLETQLKLNGLKPLTISVDNYFVERQETPKDEDGNYNFECIEAIDTKLLNEHLTKLLNGEEIKAPTFNFTNGTKEYKGNTMRLNENEILVMEGIHCLNDKLTYLIPKSQKFKIYLSALTVLNIDYYNRISTTDNRLIRRMVRDKQFRNYSAIHTLEMWPSVNKGEENNIFTFQEEADVMFNSSLIYELGVLKSYAIPLLKEIPKDNIQYSEAKRLITLLSYFETIDEKEVPTNSLLREFIGGSIFE